MNDSGPVTAPRGLFASVTSIQPREAKAVIASFFLFFFVLGSYFAVRPVRETVAIALTRPVVADLWLWTAVFSIAIVPIYGLLVARVRRAVLLPCLYGAVSVMMVIMAGVLEANAGTRAVGGTFYVWISVINLIMVSIFWSFLLEIFSTEQTKRLFGFIAAGGTFGALVGPLVTRLIVGSVGNSGILLMGAAGFGCAVLCQWILLRIWKQEAPAPSASAPSDRELGGNPFAGIMIVLRSRYLLGIAGFIVLLSAANTFLYFEQLRLVEATFTSRTEQTEAFATIDAVVQTLTVITQLFLTGRIAAAFGVRALLTVVPFVVMIGFVALAFSNVFAVLVVVLVARRWGEYAFIRPGREMLFSPLDKETKYKAKNFVDVPVYRAADYVGGQAKTALDAVSSSPAVAALVGALLAGAWGVTGYLLGRKHDQANANNS